MLTLPESHRAYRVLGIDPGTTTMGVAVLDWDMDAPQFIVRTAYTYQAANNALGYGALAETHGDRIARLYQLADHLREVLYRDRPHAVRIESPFMRKFAQSFEALVQCVHTLRHTLIEYDHRLPVELVDPPTVKRTAGVVIRKGQGKDVVAEALLARTDLRWEIDPRTLDEHGYDAVAVALTHFRDPPA